MNQAWEGAPASSAVPVLPAMGTEDSARRPVPEVRSEGNLARAGAIRSEADEPGMGRRAGELGGAGLAGDGNGGLGAASGAGSQIGRQSCAGRRHKERSR